MGKKAKGAASRKSARAKKASANDAAQEELSLPTVDGTDSKVTGQLLPSRFCAVSL
jgi:hypothetical protein